MPIKVLLGFNGSAESKDGLRLAEQLADLFDAELVVGCAYVRQLPFGRSPDSEYQRYLQEVAEQAATEVRELLARRSGSTVRVVASDSPAHALHDLAEEVEAQIIVIGSSQRAQTGTILPGGTGRQLLRGTPCAVAVAQHGYRLEERQPFATIGAAYDGSPESADAVLTAGKIARAAGAPLEIERVVWFPQPGEEHLIPAWQADIDALAAHADEQMRAVIDSLGEGISASGRTVRGGATAELVEWSDRLDLLVLGSRSYGPLRQVLLGSTSAELIRWARCPVMVVPRGVERLLDAWTGSPAGAARR